MANRFYKNYMADNLSTSVSSSLHISDIQNIDNDESVKNTDLIEYENIKEQLNKWTIPTVQPSTIYRKGIFELRSSMAVKTMEQTLSVGPDNESINLIKPHDIIRYRGKYKFMHIGLVQIAFKPLTLLGLNACIQATLRDARCLSWIPSIMGAVETSLSHGPVYFNVYPNLTLSLTDRHICESVQLKLLTKGYDFLPGAETVAVIYRVYFKLMNTLTPNIKQVGNQLGYTTLIESNMLNTSFTATNKLIRWEDIEFPERWTIQRAIPPKPIIHRDIESIVENIDGQVFLNFRKNLPRLNRSYSINNLDIPYKVSIPSSSARPSTASNLSESDIDENVSVEGIKISSNNIPHGVYKERNMPSASEINFQI